MFKILLIFSTLSLSALAASEENFTNLAYEEVDVSGIVINDVLGPNQCLEQGDVITSSNGCFSLVMQRDGNVVIYRNSRGFPIWSSKTDRSCTNRICMQVDGNFCTYDCQNLPTWASGTMNNEGSYIVMQNDGNLVIYAPYTGRVVWASRTVTHC